MEEVRTPFEVRSKLNEGKYISDALTDTSTNPVYIYIFSTKHELTFWFACSLLNIIYAIALLQSQMQVPDEIYNFLYM